MKRDRSSRLHINIDTCRCVFEACSWDADGSVDLWHPVDRFCTVASSFAVRMRQIDSQVSIALMYT